MKLKNLLLAILCLITFASCNQGIKDQITSTSATTKFEIKTQDLNKLKNYDWNAVKEMFAKNDPDQEITLGWEYINKSGQDKSTAKLENFKMKFVGKTANLDVMITKLKKVIDNLDESDYKKS